MFHATHPQVYKYKKARRTKKLKDSVMESGLLQNTTVQLLLPSQAVPRSALAKSSVAVLVKGLLPTYPISKTFPPHICFWPLLEVGPG